MRLIFFGMSGAFSYPPLAALLKAQQTGRHEVTAVIMPASAVPQIQSPNPVRRLPPERPHSELPILQPYLGTNIIQLAWAKQIPVYLVREMGNKAVYALLSGLNPDIVCVACFPFRIPANILAIPRHGFVNLHPSFLPAYRGPAPLFWIFRNGEEEAVGVTLHWMDAGYDSGDILSQRPISLPDGISGLEADRMAALLGAELLLTGLDQIEAGKAPRQPQGSDGSYQPWPTAEAFRLDPNWSARRAFNFMRGTAEWNQPFFFQIDAKSLQLREALSFDLDQTLRRPFVEKNGRYLIQFSPGVLSAV